MMSLYLLDLKYFQNLVDFWCCSVSVGHLGCCNVVMYHHIYCLEQMDYYIFYDSDMCVTSISGWSYVYFRLCCWLHCSTEHGLYLVFRELRPQGYFPKGLYITDFLIYIDHRCNTWKWRSRTRMFHCKKKSPPFIMAPFPSW